MDVSFSSRCDYKAYRIHVFCYSATTHRCDCTHMHINQEALWDVRCGQGVSGLAHTTEQGSVFVQDFSCALAHCAAEPVWATEGPWAWEEHVENQTAERLFFGFRWSAAAWKEFFFFSIMLYTQLLAIPLHPTCAFTVYIAVRIAVEFSISVDLWAGWFII